MGTRSAGAAAAEAGHGPAGARSPTNAQRHAVAARYWRPVARPAGARWVVAERGDALLPLGGPWGLGPHLGRTPAAGGCGWATRLVSALRGWHRDPGAPARGGRASRKRGPVEQALGKSRGSFSTKLHLRADRGGKPVVLLLTAGERHEQSVFVPLMRRGAVKRPGGRGRLRKRPQRLVGDKGYSSGKVRRYLRQHSIGATIPKKRGEQPQWVFDRELYRERNRVERCINRLKQYRRVATRYEKLAVNYLAMVTIAAILIWL